MNHQEPRPALAELLDLLGTHRGAPTPAQVREAFRGAAPERLVELTGLTRSLARNLETIEITAGALARTRGADDSSLVAATDLGVRTLQRRYPRRTVTVQTPGLGQLALLEYDSVGRPLPVELELNLATALLRLTTTAVDSGGADSGAILRWPLPLLTGAGGSGLLASINPLAERILIGADHDPRTDTFTCDDDALTAADEVGLICEEAPTRYPTLRLMDAQRYFADQDPAAVARSLGLPTDAGPEQVAAAAALATENALARLVVLTEAETYLRSEGNTQGPRTALSPQAVVTGAEDATGPGVPSDAVEDLFSYARTLLQALEEPIDGVELWLTSRLLGALLRAAVTEGDTLEQALQYTVPYWLASPTLGLPKTTLAARPAPETSAALVALDQYEDADEEARERARELARRALPAAPESEEAQEEHEEEVRQAAQ